MSISSDTRTDHPDAVLFSAAEPLGDGFDDCSAAIPQIEGYDILSKLGEGGMGTVWRAVQRSTKRQVALKLMSGRSFGSRLAEQRFRREVELAARLDHPGIARVFEAGCDRGVHFYAMELVEGESIDQFVQSRKLAPRQSVELMRLVCDAVQHAHQRGMIHRDLKPSNILVRGDGRPCVLDFGLARPLNGGDATITLAGQPTGTPAYMAPEQAAGREAQVDTRTDVYALGAILFQLVTGAMPHDASGSTFDVMRRIVECDALRVRQVNRLVDAELEAVLIKALARDPKDRYGGVSELSQDLHRYMDHQPLSARHATMGYLLRKWTRRHRVWLSVAAMVLLGIAALVAWGVAAVVQERDRTREQLATSLLHEADAYLLTGRWADAKSRLRQSREILRSLGQPTRKVDLAMWAAYRRSPPPVIDFPVGSAVPTCGAALADGRRVLVGAGKAVELWYMPTGRRLAVWGEHANIIRDLVVNSDQSLAATIDAGGTVRLWDVARQSLLNQWQTHERGACLARFLPDGNRLLTGGDTGGIALWDAREGKRISAWPVQHGRIHDATILPDDRTILCHVEEDGRLVPFDLVKGQWGMPFTGRVSGCGKIAIVSEASLLAAGDQAADFRLWDIGQRHGSALHFSEHSGGITSLSLNDARDRALTISSDGTAKVWEVATARSVQTLTDLGGTVRFASFLPGQRIVVTASDDGRWRVWSINEVDEAATFRLAPTDIAVLSPDGEWNAVTRRDEEPVVIQNVATGQIAQVTDIESYKVAALCWTRDGRHVLAACGDEQVRVWDVQGNRAGPPLVEGMKPVNAVVAARRSDVAVAISGEGEATVWNTAAWTIVRKFKTAAAQHGMALSPDGNLLALAESTGRVSIWHVTNGNQLSFENASTSPAAALLFSHDGKQLVIGRRDGAYICDVFGQSTPLALKGHLHEVCSLSMSEDGATLATGDRGGFLRLWELKTLEEIRIIDFFASELRDAVVFPDLKGAIVAGYGFVATCDFALGMDEAELMPQVGRAMRAVAKDPSDVTEVATLTGWYQRRGIRNWLR